MGRILGIRFGTAVTDRGGAALDIDNADDLATAEVRYEEWMRIQENRATTA